MTPEKSKHYEENQKDRSLLSRDLEKILKYDPWPFGMVKNPLRYP